MTSAPSRPTAPRPAPKPATTAGRFGVLNGPRQNPPQKILIYGTGGIGKTSLAALAPSPTFIDVDHDGTKFLDVKRITGVFTYQDLLDALNEESLWGDTRTTVIDSMTGVNKLALAYTLANVKTERGAECKSIEGYGYGKGYRHLHDTTLKFIAALDRHIERGRNVIIIAHAEVTLKPNPEGEDFKAYSPSIPQKESAPTASFMFGWCDHTFYIGYDTIAKDGKAKGSGSRRIEVREQPAFLAKSRTLRDPVVFTEGSAEIWNQLNLK